MKRFKLEAATQFTLPNHDSFHINDGPQQELIDVSLTSSGYK
jgi:hypothetical protein